MSSRLEVIKSMIASGKADAFTRYALAMEYRKAGQLDEALATFDDLRAAEPEYLPMYLMAGQMLAEAGRNDEARVWVEQGLERARGKDSKAYGELGDLLAELE